MKKCIHCGAEVPEEEAVCPACGQSVTEEAQTSENQQAQPETEKGPETDEDTCEEKTDPQEADELFKAAEENAKWRYNSYKRLSKENWGAEVTE